MSVTNLNMKLNNLPSLEKDEVNMNSNYDKSDVNDQKSEKFLKITNFFPLLKQEGKSKHLQTVNSKQDFITKSLTAKDELLDKEQSCASSSFPAFPVCDLQVILPGKSKTSVTTPTKINILKTSISQILRLKLGSFNPKKKNHHIANSNNSKYQNVTNSGISFNAKDVESVNVNQMNMISKDVALHNSEKLTIEKGTKTKTCNDIVPSAQHKVIDKQVIPKARKVTPAYSAKTFVSTSASNLKSTIKTPHEEQDLPAKPQSEPLTPLITKHTIKIEQNSNDTSLSPYDVELPRLPPEEEKPELQQALTVDTVLPASFGENQNQSTHYIISPKKQKRRHFKGATYNLYLSPSKRRRHKKKHSDTSSSIKDDESSIGGNENDSFIDSEGDNSICSEDYCSLSEKSIQEDDPVSPVTSHFTQGNNKSNKIKESDDDNCFEGFRTHLYSTTPDNDVISSHEENKVVQKNKNNESNDDNLCGKESHNKLSDNSILLSQKADNILLEDLELNSNSIPVSDKKLGCNEESDKELVARSGNKFEKRLIRTTLCNNDESNDVLIFEQVKRKIKCSEHLQKNYVIDENRCLKKSVVAPKNDAVTVASPVVEVIRTDENCDVENHSADGTIKDHSLSTIATCVKSRQRIKRRFTDDIVDTDAGILSLNCMSSSKKAKDYCSSILKPLTVNKVETKFGSASKVECVYDLKVSPVGTCACCENPVRIKKQHFNVYCQAVDSFYENRLGCCNIVQSQKLVHASVKYPFIMMCEMHLWRLKHHHCCPGCGLFCSEGTFMACYRLEKEKEVHFFHQQCMSSSDESQLCCPHCGNSVVKSIKLQFHSAIPPDFIHRQEMFSRKARMTISKQPESQPNTALPENLYTINETGKVISSVGLPEGSERIRLEAMLVALSSEKALAPKYSVKDMYTAATAGDVTKVLYMIALGFDPNFRFDEHENETALHTSAASGNLLIVHLLIQAGAVPDSMNDRLYTPLMLAVERHHKDIILYLIGAGAHLQVQGEDGMTCLHLAAKSGNANMCEILLNSGTIDVNIQDEGGWTPLVWATEHKHLDVVKLLVRRGADPNIMDNEENIGLHWSAFSGSQKICQLFLDMGCDVNAVNEHGDTPLKAFEYLVAAWRSTISVYPLDGYLSSVTRGASEFGHIAARQDVYECIFLFLSRGGNSHAQNKANKTPSECCMDQSSEVYLSLSMNMSLKKIISKFNHTAEKVIHRDVSKGKEKIPIQCVNSVDSEPPPFDFLYILENCETSPINFDRTTTTLSSCKCVADCYSFGCACGNISFRCWYDKEGCLVPEFNFLDPPLIFECNRTCSCWQNCGNRVIQNGILCRLQLIRTKGKGWGVRTLKDIPKGAFICEYVGELITDPEADRRAEDSYLFDLDYKDGDTFCLDARFYGNISRFINHLCEPNLIPVKAFVDHQDLRYPRIAFFSSREIKAYEELGFDYGEKFWSIKYKSFTCHCNSPKCKYSKDTVLETLANYNRRLREEQGEN